MTLLDELLREGLKAAEAAFDEFMAPESSKAPPAVAAAVECSVCGRDLQTPPVAGQGCSRCLPEFPEGGTP